MGFGQATLQFTSHEAGQLTWTADGFLVGDKAVRARLASILRLSLIWYGVVGIILLVTLLPGGWVYFLQRDTGGESWRFAWTWTALIAAIGVMNVPLNQFLAACGRIAETSRVAALQKALAGGIQCLVLVVGGKLLNWPAAQTVGQGLLAFWLIWYWSPTFRDILRQHSGEPAVSWWREIWPFQWKVALGALAFYLSSQIFSLVLFDGTEAGKAEAARMGASVMIMQVLIGTTLIWVGARVPLFGQLVGRRDWKSLDAVFRRVFIQSALISVAGAAVVWAGFVFLQVAGYGLGSRVLSALPLGLLLANVAVQTMIHALNSYLRAHKQEPFLWLSIAMGLAMLVAVLTFGRWYGSLGMAAALLTLNTTICLGGGSLIFIRCRRAWHADPVSL
jgi:hypothetical protein